MPTLELEKLGLVDLSNNTEVLDQTVGGGRAANATVFFAAGTLRSYSYKANYTIIEGVDRNGKNYVSIATGLGSGNGEVGDLYRNGGKPSYKGTFAGGWVTRADYLNFDNRDHITVKRS